MRTYRITLELKLQVTSMPPNTWLWRDLLDLAPNETVRVLSIEDGKKPPEPQKFIPVPGTIFLLRIVNAGEHYGLDGLLRYKQEEYDRYGPLVEFYDSRYPLEDWTGVQCQFIARYYLTTMAEFRGGGLCLQGGVPEWDVSAEGMAQVRRILSRVWEKWEGKCRNS